MHMISMIIIDRRSQCDSVFLFNTAHFSIAELQTRLEKQGRKVVVITQNIDRLHHQAGAKDIVELHGSLFLTRCNKCGDVRENRDSPIVPALKDKG